MIIISNCILGQSKNQLWPIHRGCSSTSVHMNPLKLEHTLSPRTMPEVTVVRLNDELFALIVTECRSPYLRFSHGHSLGNYHSCETGVNRFYSVLKSSVLALPFWSKGSWLSPLSTWMSTNWDGTRAWHYVCGLSLYVCFFPLHLIDWLSSAVVLLGGTVIAS